MLDRNFASLSQNSLRGLLLAVVALFCSIDTNTASAAEQVRADVMQALRMASPHVPNEVLVQFRPGVSSEGQIWALRRFRASVKEVVVRGQGRVGIERNVASQGDLVLVSLPPGLSVAQAIGALVLDADVEFAEPNWIYQHHATSDDPYYTNNSLWGMYHSTTSPPNAYGSGAAKAWANNKTDCSGIYIGIIDEGYMFTHSDLSANAGKNPGEIAGNSKDDDGNGYIDDVYGWDFDGRNNTVFDGVGDDHGTHVAGTIGGVGANGAGVAGVCWKVKLLNAKFLGSRGGTLANAILSIDYFTDLKRRHGLNLVATNNSWGGGGYSQGLRDAIERANTAGILFIAAAGNSSNNNDVNPSYPASYDNANIIAVAAITSSGALASYSNFGKTSVDLGAPGSGVWSTVPATQSRKIVSGYASYNGTSMATPHVTGAVALYAALNPGATAAQIKEKILMFARETHTPSLLNKTATDGRLNVSGF